MSTEKNAETRENQYKLLEVPEVVPGAVPTDFPEISDVLSSMKIKGSLFGFQKEDVYEKMNQLNSLYQARVQQMREQSRGQLKQMKKQQQEELEAIRIRMEQEQEEVKKGFEKELEKIREQAYAEAEEKNRETMEQIRQEIGHLTERLTALKNRVNGIAEEK